MSITKRRIFMVPGTINSVSGTNHCQLAPAAARLNHISAHFCGIFLDKLDKTEWNLDKTAWNSMKNPKMSEITPIYCVRNQVWLKIGKTSEKIQKMWLFWMFSMFPWTKRKKIGLAKCKHSHFGWNQKKSS